MSDMVPTGQTVKDAKEKLAGILRKVRAMLDKAESTDNEHEAAAFRAHAEKLMRQYRIDEEQLIAADPVSIEPIRSTIDLCDFSSHRFGSDYATMFMHIARHAGIRARYNWVAKKDVGGYTLAADAVGYEGDIRLAEVLFTQARIVFQERIEPGVNPALPDAENVYRLRSAGIERNKIARMLWDLDTHAAHAKVGKLYREACEARGEDPAVSGRNVNAKTFREVYARQFVERFAQRLREVRNAADSTGGALVLHGRAERVDEAFYTQFPELRPATEQMAPVDGKVKSRKRKSWTAADEARWQRMTNSASAAAGTAAGRAAADEVELDGVNRAKRIESSWNPWEEFNA